MNTELMTRVRDRVAGVDPDECNMGKWLDTEMGLTLKGDGICGTSGCIAGHAIAIATGQLVAVLDPTDAESIDFFLDGRGEQISVCDEASKLLDLPEYAGVMLFYPQYWPTHFQEMRENEGDQKTMVALLDGILDGLWVWTGFKWEHVAEIEEELAKEFEEDED